MLFRSNEYFYADLDLEFADLDVMAIGPVVEEVSSVFDRYWNSELAYPASVLLKGEPPTPEAVGIRRDQLNQYVADQEDSEYLGALRDSDLETNSEMTELTSIGAMRRWSLISRKSFSMVSAKPNIIWRRC